MGLSFFQTTKNKVLSIPLADINKCPAFHCTRVDRTTVGGSSMTLQVNGLSGEKKNKITNKTKVTCADLLNFVCD